MSSPIALSPLYPVIVFAIVIGAIAAAIAALRIFFTLWAPVERRINGDRGTVSTNVRLAEFSDKRVDVHLKSKTVVGGVVIVGYCTLSPRTPYPLRHLVQARHADGRIAYIRIDEVEYIEEQVGDAGSNAIGGDPH